MRWNLIANTRAVSELPSSPVLAGLSHHRAPHQAVSLPLTNCHLLSSQPRLLSPPLNFEYNPTVAFLDRVGHRRQTYRQPHQQSDIVNKMAPLFGDDTPDDVKNAKGFHLITMNTPNGQAVQIYMEELKDAYGLEWGTTLIDIFTNEQKKDWFLRLDPNGRIPVLVDNTIDPPFSVHETSAEMLYLLKHVDKQDKFGFEDDRERSECLQWTFFWHGSGAPYQGQVTHFTRVAPEKIEYAINRFRNEVLRVWGVLEIQLSGKYTGQEKDYLAGNGRGKYSVADMKTWPWVKGWERSFSKEDMQFPHLMKWIDRIAERPAVQRGIGDAYALKK